MSMYFIGILPIKKMICYSMCKYIHEKKSFYWGSSIRNYYKAVANVFKVFWHKLSLRSLLGLLENNS